MKPTTAIKVGTTLVALTGEYPTCMCGTRRHFLCVWNMPNLRLKKHLKKKKQLYTWHFFRCKLDKTIEKRNDFSVAVFTKTSTIIRAHHTSVSLLGGGLPLFSLFLGEFLWIGRRWNSCCTSVGLQTRTSNRDLSPGAHSRSKGYSSFITVVSLCALENGGQHRFFFLGTTAGWWWFFSFF